MNQEVESRALHSPFSIWGFFSRIMGWIAVIVLSTVGAWPSRSSADMQTTGMTPYQVSVLRSVDSVALSPDGEEVAYVLRVPRRPFFDDDGSAWQELHLVDTAGRSRPFVTGEVNVGSVSWTPDGENIAFLAKRKGDEHRALYLIHRAGGEARKVLEHETDIRTYSFSPDGKQASFTAADPKPKEKKDLEDEGFNQIVYEEDWLPVRVWIASLEHPGTPDTTSSKVPSFSDKGDSNQQPKPVSLDLPGSAGVVKWSPKGDRLAVVLSPTPLTDDGMMNSRIHILDHEARQIVGVLKTPGKLGRWDWSPDGTNIVLLAAQDRNDADTGTLTVGRISSFDEGGVITGQEGTVSDLLPTNETEVLNLLPAYSGSVRAAAWSTAQTIYYLGDEGVWSSLAEVGLDGMGRKTHIPTGGPVLGGLSVSDDGQAVAFTGSTPEHPSEVYYFRARSREARRLTDSNPWLAGVSLAKQEVIRHEARDGLLLEGILIHPLGEKPGVRYPLILSVHGGPESHRRNGWLTSYSSPGQVASARGFAVFYPNYRGSTGRGVEFSKMSQGDYAGKEFDDLVDAVDHLVEIGLADRDRVGITGGSYGGFAAAWGATYHSERYAAAVMFVGVSDHISKAATTDIPQEMYLVHSRTKLSEAWELFLQRSPIYHAEKSRTPILILHGKNDTRVPVGQSFELYRHLKTLGKTAVRLVLYPDEGHGNRKAAARLDYNLRMLRWMEHYLQGSGGEPPDYEVDYGAAVPRPDSES